MTERGPERPRPEGAPPAAQGWYARMERQAAPPSPGSPGGPPTAVQPTTPSVPRPKRRHAGPPGRPPGRPRRTADRGLVLWAVGALVLAAAAVVAIFFGDDIRRSSPGASERTTATDGAAPTEQPLPSDATSGSPTDATGDALPSTGTPTPSGTGDDPLGLGVPMTPPACDGTWIVVLGSATDPATYPEDVGAFLSTDPSARYVLTAGQCPALRQQTPEGEQIYAVYLGPFPDQASACATSTGIGNGAYVKQMDPAIPPDQTWQC